jgi:hypothetical protein
VLERTLEIALSRYPELLQDGFGLVGQQLATGVGILDLLFKDPSGVLQLVEVKKGPATIEATTQVLRYAERYATEGRETVPWVVAHSVSAAVESDAKRRGVRTRAISIEAVETFLRGKGTSVADVMALRRRTPGALTGGAGDLWREVDANAAYAELTHEVAELLRHLAKTPHFTLKTGAMQTTIWYRGVKLGGFNRKHRGGVGYVTSGVISPAVSATLGKLGFVFMEKHQAGSSHVHTWMEIPGSRASEFRRGLDLVRAAVDEKLGR